jgi:chitinase
MNRRLFLQSGSAAAVAAALTACGGGGGAAAAAGDSSSLAAGSSLASNTSAAPAAATAAVAAGLPAKILGCYYTAWDTGTFKITDIPTDFNVIYIFHAKPNASPVNGSWNNVGDGSFKFEYYDDVSAQMVQACRARGQRVILTVGGAQAGYAWDNRTKSQNFVDSFQVMYDKLGGVDGVDFNNFEGSIVTADNVGTVTGEMVWISRQLKARFGDNFAITSPPQPNDPVQQQLMKGLLDAGVLTYAAPQYYDWSGFNEPGYIKGRTDTWVSLLGNASNVAVGLSASYSNGPSLDDCIREWDAVKATHPGIRGMFCWCAQTNLSGGNSWGGTMKKRL